MARSACVRSALPVVGDSNAGTGNSRHQGQDQTSRSIIDFLQWLQTTADAGVSSQEHPPKRRKLTTDVDNYKSVVVKRSSLKAIFSTRLSNDDEPLRRADAPAVVSVEPLSGGLYHISIHDVSKKPHMRVLSEVMSAEDMPLRDIQLANRVTSEIGFAMNTEGQGTLWTQADIQLGHRSGSDYLEIDFTVSWNITTNLEHLPARVSQPNRSILNAIMAEYFPITHPGGTNNEMWSPQDFYRSVHVPEIDDPIAASMVVSQLETDLYPFQKRSIRWLLLKEGKVVSTDGHSLGHIPKDYYSGDLPYSFDKVLDDRGHPCYVSHLFRVVTLDVEPYRESERAIKGGILAEEMGLGKTVEIIALISMHKRQISSSGTVLDPYTLRVVQEASATLIITPAAILSQWKSELGRHAPALKVMHYEGVGSKAFRKLGELGMLSSLSTHDVVLVTYDVLGKEVHFTAPPPDRFLRHAPKYDRPRSPLMQLSWWRICLDEAQMVESGVSNAATVARHLPRVNAWGITGTPIKKDVTDLFGLLFFLRFEPFSSRRDLWTALTTNYRFSFQQLFSQLSLRHTKQIVREELRLPPQKRFVITMPFTPVEEQHYQSLFQEMCDACFVDRNGGPLRANWSPSDPQIIRSMKIWLNRLRLTASHPDIGNYRTLGKKEGPMRTVDEVLEAMLDQSEATIRVDQRALLVSKLKRGQMLENGPRVKEALDIWTEVLHIASGYVTECREQLRKEEAKHPGRVAQESIDGIDDSDDDEQDPVDNSSLESFTKIGTLRGRLRGTLEIEHMAIFFQANAYFQIKSNPDLTEPDSEKFRDLEKKETDGYELAKRIRQEILKETSNKVNRRMKKLAKKASSQSSVQIPDFPSDPSEGGIESRRILEQVSELGITLDAQANQLDTWRETTIQFLLRPLVDDESNAADITGEEYEDSTKTQDEVMVYVQALRAMIEDRHDALTGQSNILVSAEVKTAMRLAKDGEGAFPEKVLELLKIRGQLNPAMLMGSVRGVISDLRALANTLKSEAERGNSRAATELTIVESHRQKIQKQYSEQSKAVIALRQEIDDYTALMNSRLEFYRALQAVSDMVAPLEIDEDDKPGRINSQITEETRLTNKIATANAKHRYLLHLRDEAEDPEQQRMCVICQSTFELGALTVCGHQFCKECIFMWWRAHQNCPICKRKLSPRDIHDITYKPQELKVSEDIGSLVGRSTNPNVQKSGIYSDISHQTLAQIKQVELNGPSFTTKVDTLARHLIWLREADPGAKSIVFSQYKSFIDILCRALAAHRIGYVTIEDHERLGGVERFKQDPAIECFLLHARAHSSGLNLVNASHVILCEPLINTAIELQAIARVDRIGQQQETTVWLYLVDGTVEQSIHEISVRRRMEHMVGQSKKGKEKELTPELLDKTIEAANSRELQDAGSIANLLSKKTGEGENVENDDLWACLFGNVKDRPPPRSEMFDREIRRHLGTEAAVQRLYEEPGGLD